MATEVQRIYEDGKDSIWAELSPDFVATIPDRYEVGTRAKDRLDYILHPDSGERLADHAQTTVTTLRTMAANANTQIVISDGLNAHSIMDEGHLLPFLDELRSLLPQNGFLPSVANVVVNAGRVRTGYRIGEAIFGNAPGNRSILHIIGERPGTGHHTFSVYITSAPGNVWAQPDKVDHNITKVVSGIATTALRPLEAAAETVKLLKATV